MLRAVRSPTLPSSHTCSPVASLNACLSTSGPHPCPDGSGGGGGTLIPFRVESWAASPDSPPAPPLPEGAVLPGSQKSAPLSDSAGKSDAFFMPSFCVEGNMPGQVITQIHTRRFWVCVKGEAIRFKARAATLGIIA